MDIKIEINKQDLERVLKRLKRLSPGEQVSTFRDAWQRATEHVTRLMVFNVSGKILHRRTGQLSKIQYKIDRKKIVSIIGNRVISGNPVPYTAIHEYGGVIKPKHGKYLAIPMGKALTPSGVARFKPRQIESAGYDDSAVFRSKRGTLIMWGIKHLKSKDRVDPLFVLKKSVKIPARHWVSKTAKEATPGVMKILNEWVAKELSA